MTRPYKLNIPEPVGICEADKPEKILYKRGSVSEYLYGFYAWLYRGMIWMYGEAEATERFWWLLNDEKAVSVPQQNTAQSLEREFVNL